MSNILKESRKRKRRDEEEKAQPEKLWFVGTDDQGDWFEVKWLGVKQLTYQLGQNFPEVFQGILAKAKTKGSDESVSWTSCAGNGQGATQSHDLGRSCDQTGSFGERSQLPEIRFQNTTKWCALYSLLNVLESSKKKAKKARKASFGCLGGFHELHRVAGALRVSLQRIEQCTVSFVLSRESGLFLLQKGVHCISVDCTKGLIYDSARTHAMKLSKTNLAHCGFRGSLDDVRRVI